jgi:hypothetical protein
VTRNPSSSGAHRSTQLIYFPEKRRVETFLRQ